MCARVGALVVRGEMDSSESPAASSLSAEAAEVAGDDPVGGVAR